MAKTDILELAVVKAQVSAPLSGDELLELLDVDMGLLMSEHGLGLIQAEQVMIWRKQEALRYQAQSTSTYMSQYRRVEESRSHTRNLLTETRPTFGLRSGDSVRHKDEPDRGKGRVVAKGNKRDRVVLVRWESGGTQRHDPSSLVKELKRRQLRQIIREELEQGSGYPGDGNEPVLTADELELYEDDMNEVLGTIATIGAGVALGIAGLWGGVKLAGAAKSILGNMLGAAQRAAENKLGQLKGELRRDIQTQMMKTLQGDSTLDRLAKEYQELTYQVQTKPKRAAQAGGPKRGGIKGLRGDEHTITRKAQKAKAKEFADYLDSALSDAWGALDSKTAKDVRHLSSHELGMTQDVVKKYGRRDR